VEEAVSGVRRALKEARETISMMVERGEYGAAIEALAATVDKAFSRLGEALVETMRGLHESVGRLAESVNKLTEGVAELRESVADLRDIVARHEGAIRELRGWRTERDVADRLEAWFRRRAPEYEVIRWFKMGADVLVEGKGILAAVEITTVPYREAVDRIKNGVGAIKNAWGREPDVLIIWPESGVVPEEVAEYAAEKGVRVVRSVRELRVLLDEVARASAVERC